MEAAHVKGNSRKEMVDEILRKYIISKDKNIVKVDLDKFEKEIINAHRPLDKYFLFLCSKCHTKYDSE